MWFEKVSLWDGLPHNFNRLAWLSVRGVPVQLWDSQIMDQICKKYGRVLISADISAWDNDMSRTKCCVLTTVGHRIEERIELIWGSGSSPVWVSEIICDWSPDLSPGFRADGDGVSEGEIGEDFENEDYGLGEDFEFESEGEVDAQLSGVGTNGGGDFSDVGPVTESNPVEGEKLRNKALNNVPSCMEDTNRVAHDASNNDEGIVPKCMENTFVVAQEAASIMKHLGSDTPERNTFEAMRGDGEVGSTFVGGSNEKESGSNADLAFNEKNDGQAQAEGHVPSSQHHPMKANNRSRNPAPTTSNSTRGHQGGKARPISLKLKDRLWVPKKKLVTTEKDDSCGSGFESRRCEAQELDSSSHWGFEARNTIEVGNLVGYKLQGHEGSLKSLLIGEESSRFNQ